MIGTSQKTIGHKASELGEKRLLLLNNTAKLKAAKVFLLLSHIAFKFKNILSLERYFIDEKFVVSLNYRETAYY